jgi:hypothetical protein
MRRFRRRCAEERAQKNFARAPEKCVAKPARGERVRRGASAATSVGTQLAQIAQMNAP